MEVINYLAVLFISLEIHKIMIYFKVNKNCNSNRNDIGLKIEIEFQVGIDRLSNLFLERINLTDTVNLFFDL